MAMRISYNKIELMKNIPLFNQRRGEIRFDT